MDTHMFVLIAKLKPNCSMVLVFRWHNIFSDSCDDIGACKRSARPKHFTENAMKSVRKKLSENCSRTHKSMIL